MNKTYKVSVQSAPDCDEVYAEVEFPRGVAFLVSLEDGDTEYKVLGATRDPEAWAALIEARNLEKHRLKLDDVITASSEAKVRRRAMPKRRL